MHRATTAGTITIGDDFTITRMGYGAMQLAGLRVFGPPKDRAAAIAVLREAVALGVTHIDTSDFYGPYVVNEIIKEALYPYPEDLHIVTKVGALRGNDASWLPALSAEELTSAVHSNLEHLGLSTLDVVNLRIGTALTPERESVAEPFKVLAKLKDEGLIKHLGISNVDLAQLREAQAIAPVVTVQNLYNVASRESEELVDICAKEGIVFTPFHPLGGFTPLQSEALTRIASDFGTSTQQIALAWLLQRSPAIALIPGTASVEHLHDNMAAADLKLPPNVVEELNAIGAK
jgi:pyridoxine 4-dehydrogenase